MSSPRSSAAPATIASSTSRSGWRELIERWMRASRSSSVWRSCSEASSWALSAAWASLISREVRSSSSSRRACSARLSTWAMPRSSARSSWVNGSLLARPTTSRAPLMASQSAVPSAHGPTPSTSSTVWPPWAASTSAATGHAPAGKPRLCTIWPSATRAAISQSSASATCSTARWIAVMGSGSSATAAMSSVSCWVDQCGEVTGMSAHRRDDGRRERRARIALAAGAGVRAGRPRFAHAIPPGSSRHAPAVVLPLERVSAPTAPHVNARCARWSQRARPRGRTGYARSRRPGRVQRRHLRSGGRSGGLPPSAPPGRREGAIQ